MRRGELGLEVVIKIHFQPKRFLTGLSKIINQNFPKNTYFKQNIKDMLYLVRYSGFVGEHGEAGRQISAHL